MDRPVAIEVREVSKSFRIPEPHSSFSARVRRSRPPGGTRSRELEVLRDISFDVRRGEFFGVVGRNGSGKSTLLKLFASIYRVDRGSIRLAGRLAPFLELGVGFNPELPAFDNVVLNGVMMGLTPAEAKRRYEEIVDFAGLSDYTDLKLKNYSSGMKVRLGFAVMTHVDADVLLIDEVLAVGDAEFQERCGDVFRRMHDEGRTIVFVSHNMPAVSLYCQRAMLLHDGRIDSIGEPEEVTNRYIELNMRAIAGRDGREGGFHDRTASALAEPSARIVDTWLAGTGGTRLSTLRWGEPIELHALIELDRQIEDPRLWLRIQNSRGQILFMAGREELGVPLQGAGAERVRVRATIENRLVGGRYLLSCAILRRGPDGTPEPAGRTRQLSLEVPGRDLGGLVALEHDVVVEVEPDREVVSR